MATPKGKGGDLDSFNAQLRANPEYRQFLQSMGVNPDRPVNLSGQQRSAAERWVRGKFPELSNKFQVDPAGNINTDHGLSTAWSNPYFRYPLIAGGALATAGALGAFGGAGAGAGAGGGTAAGAGAAAGAGSTVPAWMTGAAAPAIASQGISQTLGKTAGGGLGSWLGKVGGGIGDALFSKQGMGALAGIIPALMAMKGGGPFSGGGDNRGMDLAENAYQDAQRINAMKEARFRRVDPLHEAVTQLAFNRMPTTNATNGIDLQRVPLPPKQG